MKRTRGGNAPAGFQRLDQGRIAAELGARVVPGGVRFTVWAPKTEQLAVRLLAGNEKRTVQLHPGKGGYFTGVADQARAGDRYVYRLDGGLERPDPASSLQPEGVHGPSQVVDFGRFAWTDHDWENLPLSRYVIYELHVGAFTREGTFEGVVRKLPYLRELGVTAIELMPVPEFPGNRNWGYDGAYPFAPHHSYGGPDGLMALVDACHGHGLAVVLDVVYNHLGPEGCYVHDFGHYLTGHYRTPWGDAMNFDGPHSDHVRAYFIANAVHWIRNYHVDALRLDAVHRIFDFGAFHFLRELNEAVEQEAALLGRRAYVIAESDLNDVRLIDNPDEGGYGLDGQWSDDFHHCVHSLLTGERDGYYRDFDNPEQQLLAAFTEKFVYSGQYSPSRLRRHGNSASHRPDEQFVVCCQNHDQVGNRMLGERLATLVSFESLKLAAGLLLLSPYVPLLFMGEEYGEDRPFLYFVSHGDHDLVAAVRAGRKEEFREFHIQGDPPDPAAEETYLASRLAWEKVSTGKHSIILRLYRSLIMLRRKIPALAVGGATSREAALVDGGDILWVVRHRGDSTVLCLFNLGDHREHFVLPVAQGRWRKVLDTAEPAWDGPGTDLPADLHGGEKVGMRGRSCAVYERQAGRA